MKVYVCIEENVSGHEILSVCTSLGVAQEKMRDAFHAYVSECGNEGFDPSIGWYSGAHGKWGWYDECSTNGFYVEEVELDSNETTKHERADA